MQILRMVSNPSTTAARLTVVTAYPLVIDGAVGHPQNTGSERIVVHYAAP